MIAFSFIYKKGRNRPQSKKGGGGKKSPLLTLCLRGEKKCWLLEKADFTKVSPVRKKRGENNGPFNLQLLSDGRGGKIDSALLCRRRKIGYTGFYCSNFSRGKKRNGKLSQEKGGGKKGLCASVK